MVRSRGRFYLALSTLLISILATPAWSGGNLAVVGTTPARHTGAPRTTAISVDFDQPLDIATVTMWSFRVFGLWSGPMSGTTAFSNGDQTLTFTPDDVFSVGEVVTVQIATDAHVTWCYLHDPEGNIIELQSWSK